MSDALENHRRLGVELWNRVYRGNDVTAPEAFRRMVAAVNDLRDDGSVEFPPSMDDTAVCLGMWLSLSWVHAGCPQLVTGHKFAAALMCTPVPRTLADDLEVPWKSFVVCVPGGLLVDRLDIHVDFIRVAEVSDGKWIMQCVEAPSGERPDGVEAGAVLGSGSIADVLFEETNRHGRPELVALAQRLTVGLLLTMQNTVHFRRIGAHVRCTQSQRGGPPGHRVFFVGRPIGVDCRPAVRTALSEIGSVREIASVQSLVRGHHKRQVVGISRVGRKVIWVEPYWRGPEDAPILARPYMVGASNTKEETP